MPLQAPDPPDEAVDALRGALGALGDRGQFGVRALRRARPEQITVAAPHQVFTLGLDDLRERPSLATAKPSAWRFLIEVDREVVASAETTTISDREHEFSHVNEGPFVVGTVEALEIAERVADERNVDFDFRLFHIPAIYSVNVWAHRRGRGNPRRGSPRAGRARATGRRGEPALRARRAARHPERTRPRRAGARPRRRTRRLTHPPFVQMAPVGTAGDNSRHPRLVYAPPRERAVRHAARQVANA